MDIRRIKSNDRQKIAPDSKNNPAFLPGFGEKSYYGYQPEATLCP